MTCLKVFQLDEERFTLAWWCTDPDYDLGDWGGELEDGWQRTPERLIALRAKPHLSDNDLAELECAAIFDAAMAAGSYKKDDHRICWSTRKQANEALKAARIALKDLKVGLKLRTPPEPPWMVQARAHGWMPPKDAG